MTDHLQRRFSPPWDIECVEELDTIATHRLGAIKRLICLVQ
jgi:hypothetical protein